MIKKIIMTLLVLSTFMGMKEVGAKESSLVMDTDTHIYYAMYNEDFYRSYLLARLFQDGKRVYCITPNHAVTSDTYEEKDSVDIYSSEILDRIHLIAHFGSDYPGHNTIYYELATQALIWETIEPSTVRWYTERYSYGDEIDVSKERREIERLISESYQKPNFDVSSIVGAMEDRVTIHDLNHMLNHYEITSFDGGVVAIENDEIKLLLKEQVGDYRLVLKRKTYDDESTTYYVKEGSQTMMLGRMRKEEIVIPVTIQNGKVTLQKIGKKLNGEEEKLKGVSFVLRARENIFYFDGTLRYGQDELIGKYETDENGMISLFLPYGKYYFEEEKQSEGYLLKKEEIQFTVEEGEVIIEAFNEESYGNVTLYKKDHDTLLPLEGILFRLTNQNTGEILEGKTDKEGKLTFSKMPLGTYQIKEIETLPGYILNEEEMTFELKELEEFEYTFYNDPIKDIPKTASYDFSLFFYGIGALFIFYGKKN